MNEIKVSVIIPVYNAEKYLRESLDCIVNQTEKNIEIICIDDGSTDESLTVLKSFSEKNSRLKIFTQENLGASAARNNGIRKAYGEYLYFFDADDLCDITLIEKTLSIAKEKNADIVAFNGEKFFEDGTVEFKSGINHKNIPNNINVFSWKDIPDSIIQTVNVVPWNKIIRADFIKKNQIWFEEISSSNDITFSAVCNAKAERIAFTTEKLHKYRVGISGTITSTKSKKLHNIIKAVESAEQQIKDLPYYDEISKSAKKFVIENYLYPFNNKDNIPDFDASIVEDYYTFVHNKFNDDEYKDCSEYFSKNPKYYDFLKIRNSDYKNMQKMRKRKIIVSMTSFPARIHCVPEVLKTIFQQTEKPSKICLYLAESQFLNKENDLPEVLQEYDKSGKIEIRWCEEDIRPHKKYFYAFHDFPDDLIVTVDDDLLYEPNIIEILHKSYMINPNCVSASRCHIIATDEKKNILPYAYWIKEVSEPINVPLHSLLATGGAGCLYPATLFSNGHAKDMLNISLIKELCINADDLWLKAMELLNDIPVVLTGAKQGLHYVPESQEVALWKDNVTEGDNDVQFQNIIDWISKKYGKNIFNDKLFSSCSTDNLLKKEYLYNSINNLQIKLRRAENRKDNLAEKLEWAFTTARIDIKNFGAEANALEITECSDSTCTFYTPDWLKNAFGQGQFVQTQKKDFNFSVKALGDGELKLYLKAVCLRNKEQKSTLVRVAYKKLVVDGKEVFGQIRFASHDEPLVHSVKVKDGQIVNIQIEWECEETAVKKLINDLCTAHKEREKLQKNITDLKQSMSWKVGRIMTLVPSKIKNVLRKIKHYKIVQGGGVKTKCYVKPCKIITVTRNNHSVERKVA